MALSDTSVHPGQTEKESEVENGMGSEDELLTVSEIAGVLKVPTSWVYERTRRSGTDQIPHIKLGKYLRFRWPAVREWLETMNRN